MFQFYEVKAAVLLLSFNNNLRFHFLLQTNASPTSL